MLSRIVAVLLLLMVVITIIISQRFQMTIPMHKSDSKVLTVSGVSMLPTLEPGDQVRLEDSTAQTMQSGDLIAIKFSTRERKMLKRLIALPGDRVEFIDGQLKLNGQWLDTAWWPKQKRLALRQYKLLALQLSRYDNQIPPASAMVMGDNASKSYDSGDFGLISLEQIVGLIRK